MQRPRLALLLAALAAPAAAQEPGADLPETVVTAQRAAAARQAVLPALGARAYEIGRGSIEAMPGGADQPLNQVLQQAPGVVQDSFGEIHIRGEHRNLQYRLNGVALPEGLSGFGQVFDIRGLSSVGLLTGALPAQFGFRTNAVINLETRSGALDPGGSLGLYGGSRGLLQPHATWAGVVEGWDILATGSLLRSNQGIENPTASRQAQHNATEQTRYLLSAARQLDQTTRLTLLTGAAHNRFQIPTRPGLDAPYGEADSDSLRARQWERSRFATIAVQKSWDAVELQVAPFLRSSSIHYLPSTLGELAINGIASDVYRASTALGVQSDLAWRLAPDHTLRAGFQASGERAQFRSLATVLPLDADGEAFGAPFSIASRSGRTGWLYGVYVQDEWRVAPRLTLNAGLRWDQMVGYVTAGQLSPRLNLVYRATETTTLHAGYARSFTPPQFELLGNATLAAFANTTGAAAGTGNDPVRPERAHRFDIGVAQRLGANLTLGVDGYYKAVRDLLDYGQFGNALIFTPFNYHQGRVYGVEFSGTWRSERWLAFANLALSRSAARGVASAQFTFDADELAQIARKYVRTDHDQLLTGSAGAAYRAWEGGRLSASLRYGSGLRSGYANSEKLSPYATLNLGLAQEFSLADGGTWTARLDLLNVTDARYQIRSGTGIGVGAPQFGARRGVYAGLSRSF
jgi:outer membrane receptor protein involved in Fe transport